MCIRFNKVDGFTRIYDGARHLVLFAPEKYDAIYNWIRYIISLKSDITFIFFYYYAKIKVDFYSLPIEKRLTSHNVIIIIKLVLNKHQNHYYYSKMLLEKCWYQSPKK